MELEYGQLYTFKGKKGDANQFQCITYKNFDLYIPNYQITMYWFNINIYIQGPVHLLFDSNQSYTYHYILPSNYTGAPSSYNSGNVNQSYALSVYFNGNNDGENNLIFGTHRNKILSYLGLTDMKLNGNSLKGADYEIGEAVDAANGYVNSDDMIPGSSDILKLELKMYNSGNYYYPKIVTSNSNGTSNTLKEYVTPYMEIKIGTNIASSNANKKVTFKMYTGADTTIINTDEINVEITNINKTRLTCEAHVTGTLKIISPYFYINN